MDIEYAIVDALKHEAVDVTLSEYLDMIGSEDPSTLKNRDWRQFLEMLARERDRSGVDPARLLATVFRQVMLDTLATALAVLDGVLVTENLKGDIQICYDGQPVPQTLNDTLWETEEE